MTQVTFRFVRYFCMQHRVLFWTISCLCYAHGWLSLFYLLSLHCWQTSGRTLPPFFHCHLHVPRKNNKEQKKPCQALILCQFLYSTLLCTMSANIKCVFSSLHVSMVCILMKQKEQKHRKKKAARAVIKQKWIWYTRLLCHA